MYSFEEFSRELNELPTYTRSSLINPNNDERIPQTDERETILRDKDESFHVTRRTENNRNRPQMIANNRYSTYNTSGDVFNLSRFHENGRMNEITDSIYNSSGRPLTTMDFSAPEYPNHQSSSNDYHQIQSSTQGDPIMPQRKDSFKTPLNFRYPKTSPEKLLTFTKREDIKPVTNQRSLYNDFVKDTYYPGVIEDSVNGKIDFNKVAFDKVFACGCIPCEMDPNDTPMSLLEAFELRINYENNLLTAFENGKTFCQNEKIREQFSKTKKNAPTEKVDNKNHEKTMFWTHRDELKLASTVDIDLLSKTQDCPKTELTEAILCLLKAEKMNDFDERVHLAEEAIDLAPEDKNEFAALKSTCSFKMDMKKEEAQTNNSYQPLAIISYVGTTKPDNI